MILHDKCHLFEEKIQELKDQLAILEATNKELFSLSERMESRLEKAILILLSLEKTLRQAGFPRSASVVMIAIEELQK